MSEINEQSCGWCDITVSPDSVYFEVVEDWKFIPSGKYVRLERDGSGMSPRWSAVGSEEWIRITPLSGDVPKRACQARLNRLRDDRQIQSTGSSGERSR